MLLRAVGYINEMRRALGLLRADEVVGAYGLLARAMREGRGVFTCGNGGSAATASHLAVDLGKNVPSRADGRIRVVSLTDNVPWMTAVANDLGYENCFTEQLRNYLAPGDIVVGISASGESENVVRAFELADQLGAERLALVGFDGGRLAKLATRSVWVPSHDYGVVESLHLIAVHMLVRMLSPEPLPAEPIESPALCEPLRAAHRLTDRVGVPVPQEGVHLP